MFMILPCKSWAIKKTLDALADGEFHKFGVLWTQAGYEFYIDDELSDVATSHVPISTAPSYIILSSEVPRTGFPVDGSGDRASADTDFDIKSVKVYPLVDYRSWGAEQRYRMSDIIRYNGVLYSALEVHQANEIETPDVNSTQWAPLSVGR